MGLIHLNAAMRQGGKISKLARIFVFCLPLVALADAGTPLMWAGMLHMLFGNALIGIGEGLLLAFLFKLGRGRCIWIMVAANYFSAWVGYVFLLGYGVEQPADLNLYTAWGWIWRMIVITFLLTCILEWPFVFRCLRGVENRLKKSIWANVVAQTASYVLIFAWYWGASGRSLYTQTHVVQPAGFPIPANTVVYFISTNGDVCSLKPTEGGMKKVASLNNTNDENRLFLQKSESGKTSICVRFEASQDGKATLCLVSNMEVTATVPKYDEEPNEHRGNWSPQWFVTQIGEATNSAWSFLTGFWGKDGLYGTNRQTGEKIHLALETPYVQWIVRNAYELPNDCVVFQLGFNQICIFDPKTRRVALLARGYGPVVVVE
jgi:hypothetical protein